MKSSRSTLRSIALLLALTGVLFRGMIPAGYMPAMGADARAGALLVLCSGSSLKAVGAATDPDGAPAAHAMDECPFAAAASPGLPPAPLQLALQRETAGSTSDSLPVVYLPAASRIRPPARAPPLTA